MLQATLELSLLYLIATWLLCAAVVRYAAPRFKGLPTALACFATFNVFTLATAIGRLAGIGLPKALQTNDLTEILVVTTAWLCLCPMFLFVLTKKWPPEEVAERAIVCGNCGYDLRGNTSGVCPECGNHAI